MATATPNIMIKSIRGRMGNVVFYTRPRSRTAGSGAGDTIQCVRAYVVPRNPDTEAQRIVRRTFAEAVHSWQAMTPDDKYAFVRKARHLNMSGYNLHISQYMKTMLALKLLSGSALNPVSHDRIHSVSDTHKAGYGTKTRTGGRKKCPG